MSKLIATLFLLSLGLVLAVADKKVVCYFGSWSIYRPGNGAFEIEGIDPHLCTHLVYTFVGINGDGSIRILDPNSEIDRGGFRKFNALKNQNPNLKTLVAIGGYNEGSAVFSQVSAQPNLRTAFVNNAVNFVKQYGFDGFDLDWEYPARGDGSNPADKQNFGLLVKEFREVFDRHGLLLTAAVGATSSHIDASYDVPTLSKYLHFINIMAYDLHGYYDGFTGQNAPLYPSSKDVTEYQKQLNVAAVIKAWIDNGADPQKLVLGLGMYGRSYTLSNPQNNGIGAEVSAAGNKGPYTGENGMLGYNEICEFLQNGQWTVIWDEEQQVPYAYNGNQWVGYDDPKSIAAKVQYGKNFNLGGYMIWAIDTEDFRGSCGQKYPLLHAINAALK